MTSADPLERRPPRERLVEAPVDAVWRVVADGWSYATWVVGASRVRRVDRAWPAPGSAIHHSVGLWPLLLSDTTEVEACSEHERLVLRARARPFGEARVSLELEERGPATLVRMREDVASGPARLLPVVVRQAAVHPRNAETLQRLAYLAERRDG